MGRSVSNVGSSAELAEVGDIPEDRELARRLIQRVLFDLGCLAEVAGVSLVSIDGVPSLSSETSSAAPASLPNAHFCSCQMSSRLLGTTGLQLLRSH